MMQSDSLARTRSTPKPDHWRDQIRNGFHDTGSLLDFLGLPAVDPYRANFPALIPRAFARRMEHGNPKDPLLRQVLPDPREMEPATGFVADPVGDREARRDGGILHKYHGRALIVTTGACAVHCRYCFRQSFPYAAHYAGRDHWDSSVDYIAGHKNIEEVILSGGDPLMLPTRRLEALTTRLAGLAHIKRFRIHTRLPIVLPDRVTDNLNDWLASLPWPTVMVVHANHAREFDDDVDAAMDRLRRAGVHLLNQAVVLAGINDSADSLAALMRRGMDAGILPYYLHLLDRVEGAARFEVAHDAAAAMVEQLRRELSGYLVPRLVREQAGAPYKLPIL